MYLSSHFVSLKTTNNHSLRVQRYSPIGNFVLDNDQQMIQLGEQNIHLRQKLMLVLQALIQNNGRLISRDSLIDQIWRGNYYTGKKGLTHTICLLRRILNLDIKQSVRIITIPKRGYRLEVSPNSTHSKSQSQFQSQPQP